MFKRQNAVFAGLFMAVAALMGIASAANAIIEDAKDKCIIGEQVDGYLGIVDEAAVDSALRREMRDVNQQRKSFYADLAKRNGVTVEVTAALTAEKLIRDAEPGECTRGADGRWTKKR